MSNSITITPEQFIFAQGEELITTSLKIAEAFGKRHDNIIRTIHRILPQVSDSFGKLNFEETVVERENPSGGLAIKSRMYNITKDGFLILVMGFTGQQAMTIKEAYITAFNQMAKKLFPQTQYGLKELPEPQGITKAQQGELFTLVTNKSSTSGKPRAYFWARFQNHFKLNSYKSLPFDKYEEGLDYFRKLEGDCEGGFVSLTHQELSAVIKENRVKQGELLESNQSRNNCFSIQVGKDSALKNITLQFDTDDKSFDRWFVSKCDGSINVQAIPLGDILLSFDKWVEYATKECGYVVFKSDEINASKMVRDFIPAKLLPVIIEAAGKRLNTI